MMRKYKLFAVFLLVLAFLPLPAYAFDAWPNGTYWTGITTPAHYGAFVRADDIYGAAVYGLNKDPATISVEDRLKLSDPDYGGRFYVYAQTFFNVDGWPNMPEWLPAYVMAATVGLGQSFERVYASEVSTTLRDEALRDLERVLAGEDLGGSSDPGDVSSGIPESVVLDTLHGYFPCNKYGDKFMDPSGSVTVNFTDRVGLASTMQGLGASYLYPVEMYYSYHAGSSHTTGCRTYVFISDAPVTFSYRSDTSNRDRPLYVTLSSTGNIYSAYVNGSPAVYYNAAPPTFKGSSNFGSPTFQPVGSSYTVPTYWDRLVGTQAATIPSAPVVVPPSGDWPEPETPVNPDPPEQPTPTAPTVTPDNDPTEPVVTWPTSPTVVLPTQPTPSTTPSGLDYTGLLTLINDNLISIDDYVQALNSSFNSFRADFVTAVDSIVDSIRNIYNYLGHLNDILEVHCKHIRDQIEDSVYNLELYLKGLFEWLPRQLDYDAEFNYDDSYVTMLLQRILNKIPGGSAGTPVTYQPNPQSDEPGFFDWLLDLWHRFLIDLVSVLPDELGGLVDAFSQLTHYFPFSIPWDLAALLSLFEHEPVTPVFDVPWGFGGDEGEIQMVRVDLHCWDGVMEMVRPVFVAGFCIQLALITKELLENFDIHRGGV